MENLLPGEGHFSREEEAELFRRMAEGDTFAREELFEKLQPFVRKVVRDCVEHEDVRYFDDLVQAGNKRLSMALENFDVAREVRLATYAKGYVIGEVVEEMWRCRGLREGVSDHSAAVIRARAELRRRGPEEPSVAQIAEEAGISAEKVQEVTQTVSPRRLGNRGNWYCSEKGSSQMIVRG